MNYLKYSIYIPGQSMISTVVRTLADTFGGATSETVTGSWIMRDGSLVQEPITVVYTLVPEDKAGEATQLLTKLATTIKLEERQESVLVTAEPMHTVRFI